MQLLFKGQSFSSSILYLSYVVFIIQLLLSKELFHQSWFYLSNIHFHHPACIYATCCFHHLDSTLQRTISSSQVLFNQRSLSSSSFFFAKNNFINPCSI